MIVTQVAAQVRRVLRGHSERALVHAVDAEGLEYKVEVPLAAVRAMSDGEGYVLMISYAIHTVPGLAPPLAEAAEPAAPTSTTTPAPETAGAAPIPGGPGASSASEDAVARDAADVDAARVDAQFMALMDRRGGAGASPEVSASAATDPTTDLTVDPIPDIPTSSPEPLARATDDPIAALLGLRR